MIRQWVIYNKFEDFISLLNYTDEDFKPHGCGNLSYYKENGDSVVKMMSTTPLQMLENLRCNRILFLADCQSTWVGPQNTPTWFEDGDKPGAQLVGFEQATTKNTLKIGKILNIQPRFG